MADNTVTLSNAQARKVFVARHLLDKAPFGGSKGGDLAQVVQDLGFVQVDSINTAARAHDAILWARRQSYRPDNLRKLVDQDRLAFEGWTHDASVLPVTSFVHWKHKFTRDKAILQKRYKKWHRGEFETLLDQVFDQIGNQGPSGSADVGLDEKRGSGGWWDWHPSKTALEFLWRTGRICVSRREGFIKLYDHTSNVIPDTYLTPETT